MCVPWLVYLCKNWYYFFALVLQKRLYLHLGFFKLYGGLGLFLLHRQNFFLSIDIPAFNPLQNCQRKGSEFLKSFMKAVMI